MLHAFFLKHPLQIKVHVNVIAWNVYCFSNFKLVKFGLKKKYTTSGYEMKKKDTLKYLSFQWSKMCFSTPQCYFVNWPFISLTDCRAYSLAFFSCSLTALRPSSAGSNNFFRYSLFMEYSSEWTNRGSSRETSLIFSKNFR